MIYHLTDGKHNFLSYDEERRCYTIKELSGVEYTTVPEKELRNKRIALMRLDSYRMNMGNGLCGVDDEKFIFNRVHNSVAVDKRVWV